MRARTSGFSAGSPPAPPGAAIVATANARSSAVATQGPTRLAMTGSRGPAGSAAAHPLHLVEERHEQSDREEAAGGQREEEQRLRRRERDAEQGARAEQLAERANRHQRE